MYQENDKYNQIKSQDSSQGCIFSLKIINPFCFENNVLHRRRYVGARTLFEGFYSLKWVKINGFRGLFFGGGEVFKG